MSFQFGQTESSIRSIVDQNWEEDNVGALNHVSPLWRLRIRPRPILCVSEVDKAENDKSPVYALW